MSSASTNTLPFSKEKQSALLGHILTDANFFLQCKTLMESSWYVEPYTAKVYTSLVNFYGKHSRCPLSLDELKQSDDFLQSDTADANKMRAAIDNALHNSKLFGLDVLRKELTSWMHARIYHEGMHKSEFAFNKQKFDEAYSIIKETSHKIEENKFDDDLEVKFDNYIADLEKGQQQRQDALTIGIPEFDRLLIPDGTGGGLLPGDTTTLLAPTNVGKTTTMITIAVHNILKGKSVLFITHEGRPSDIQEKVWQSIMGITKAELLTYYKDPVKKALMDGVLQRFISKYFVYVPMNKTALNVEEVESVVRLKQEERIRKTGKGFDLLIDDYPAKLSTTMAKGGNLGRRHIDDIVYNRFVSMGLEHNFHVINAIQTNRAGSETNKDADRLLQMEDVSESWGPMTAATNVISINRDEFAIARNYVTFLVCKSRSSETGWAITCESAYQMSRTHHPNLKYVKYQGTRGINDIHTLLQQSTTKGEDVSNKPVWNDKKKDKE